LEIRVTGNRSPVRFKIEIMNFYKLYIFSYLFFFCSLWGFDLEDQEKIKQIQEVIEKGSRYELQAIELFDGETPWGISRGTSFLESIRFTLKYPDIYTYKLESELYYKSDFIGKRQSMQIHSSIEIPGRDKWFLKPEFKKSLNTGSPVRVFFWVYSNNYDISLKVIFSQTKSKDIVVNFGTLKFNGWRRLDARITIHKLPDKLNLSKLGQFELKGVLLESNSLQQKGNFYIFLDQMGVLIEKPETYPGSEVPDGWELF